VRFLVALLLIYPDFSMARSGFSMVDLVDTALVTKDTLVGYLQSVTEESRKVSLPTVHFLQDSLGSYHAILNSYK
jgi:hypothetical protein